MRRIGIIGAGRFGSALATGLAEKGVEVTLLDRDRDKVQRLSSVVAKAVAGDATDGETLVQAGFGDCDVVVVAIGPGMEASILATQLLKEMNVSTVIAKAGTDTHGKVLSRVGADQVVYVDRERAARLARTLSGESALDYFEISEGVSIVEMKAPWYFCGKSFAESKIRNVRGVTVLAIRRQSRPAERRINIIAPTGDDVIEEDDTLVIFGPNDNLEKLAKEP